MNLTLSWDLFVIVFFALVLSYSFIIGKKESIKIILASYIAIVAVQGIGSISQRFLGDPSSLFGTLGLPVDPTITSILKLTVFITFIVFLAVRAGLHVQYSQEGNMATNLGITALCGLATGGLLLATLITYIAGAPLMDAHLVSNPALATVMKQSELMQLLVANIDVLFTLPAVALILAGVMNNR